MSEIFDKVVGLIILERFGETVETVVKYLLKNGACSLFHLKKFVNLPLMKIKSSLTCLLRHNLIHMKIKYNSIIYCLLAKKILLMLRYPTYVKLLKSKYDTETSILLEELLQRGCMNEVDLINVVHSRLININKTVNLLIVKERFNTLKHEKYLIDFLPSDDVKCFPEDAANAKPNWTVNFDRFHQDLRDELIITAFENKFDNNAAELIKLFIRQMYIRTEPWAENSNPIPGLEVKDLLKQTNSHQQLLLDFDQYVSLLEQDNSQFMVKTGEASGGSYQLNMKRIFSVFAWEICEQYVLERFDVKAARIFRLVKNKGRIEPENIQKLAMIPPTEAKFLTYQLLEENIFKKEELRKVSSGNAGQNKSFTLFYIQQDQLVRDVLHLCYKFIFNIMTRRINVKHLNQRIIDKKQRIDAVLLSMRTQGATEEQLNDIEEMLTPPERGILEKIEASLKKLNMLELQIDQTIFYLDLYLQYL